MARKIILLLIVNLFFTHKQVFSQERFKLVCDGRRVSMIKPLVIINNLETEVGFFFFNANQIDAINVFKDTMAIAKYGEKGKDGVIEVKLKQNVQLLTAKNVVDKYGLCQSNLRICVNETIIDRKELLLFDATEIVSVEIINNPKWVNTTDIKQDEQFINITVKTTSKQ